MRIAHSSSISQGTQCECSPYGMSFGRGISDTGPLFMSFASYTNTFVPSFDRTVAPPPASSTLDVNASTYASSSALQHKHQCQETQHVCAMKGVSLAALHPWKDGGHPCLDFCQVVHHPSYPHVDNTRKCSMIRVYGLRFGVWGLGFRIRTWTTHARAATAQKQFFTTFSCIRKARTLNPKP
jgi:hypothetical protein